MANSRMKKISPKKLQESGNNLSLYEELFDSAVLTFSLTIRLSVVTTGYSNTYAVEEPNALPLMRCFLNVDHNRVDWYRSDGAFGPHC